LRENGCIVTDEVFCEKVLSRISYYRLSAYFLTFKMKDGKYSSGTEFNKIFRLYEFDRKLRNLLFSTIEELEVYLRAQLSYYHSQKYGPIGYLDSINFNSRHDHVYFLSQINSLIKSNNKTPFVRHHIKKYSGQFPLWVIAELFTFGMLSYFYADMITADQKRLARSVFHSSVQNIKSWLYCCTNLRNICAHSRRLYNNVFSVIPANIPAVNKQSERRLFASIMAVREMYSDVDKWNNELLIAISALIDEYRDTVQLRYMGFPTNWYLLMKK